MLRLPNFLEGFQCGKSLSVPDQDFVEETPKRADIVFASGLPIYSSCFRRLVRWITSWPVTLATQTSCCVELTGAGTIPVCEVKVDCVTASAADVAKKNILRFDVVMKDAMT